MLHNLVLLWKPYSSTTKYSRSFKSNLGNNIYNLYSKNIDVQTIIYHGI